MEKRRCTGSRALPSDLLPVLHVWQSQRERLRRLCLRWTAGNGADAEDLLSEAVLRALESGRHRRDDIRSPRAWVATIIGNLGRDRMRKRTREVLFDPDDIVGASFRLRKCPDENLHARHELEKVFGSSSTLSFAERHILLERCLGAPYGEIASALRVTEGSARKLVHRAREQLKANASGSTATSVTMLRS